MPCQSNSVALRCRLRWNWFDHAGAVAIDANSDHVTSLTIREEVVVNIAYYACQVFT